MSVNLDETDPLFVFDLERSKEAELVMLNYFARKGRMVVRPPQFLRPTAEERVAYADTGDLYVAQRWEIKHRMIEFNTMENFPYSDVFVDPIPTFEQKRPRPTFYAFCNKSLTHAIIVNVDKSYEHWTEREDTSHNRKRTILCCPREHFAQIVKL